MARSCTICTHKKRLEIDEAIVSGIPFRAISRRFRVSDDAVSRHRAHVGEAVKRAAAGRQSAAEETLLARLKAVQVDTLEVCREAKRAKDRETQLRAISRVEKQLELEARLLGELTPAPVQVTNVFASADFEAFIAELVGCLGDVPGALDCLRTLVARQSAAAPELFPSRR